MNRTGKMHKHGVQMRCARELNTCNSLTECYTIFQKHPPNLIAFEHPKSSMITMFYGGPIAWRLLQPPTPTPGTNGNESSRCSLTTATLITS